MGSGKNKKKGLGLVIIGLALIGMLIGLLIGYLSRPGERRATLPFEEMYVSSKQLSRDIHHIDKAIADAFSVTGVPHDKVAFLSVSPRQKNEYRWDFSSMEARIPNRYSVLRIGDEIRERVGGLRIPVRIVREQESAGELIYRIYCRTLLTHRVTIIADGYQSQEHAARPKIGIIIDDLGYDGGMANAFMRLELPLTLSVLPFTAQAQPIAHRAKKEGYETMLHLPMEPLNFPDVNPGKGVLLVSMERSRMLETLAADLSQVPFVVGVNNHMGSRFTASEAKMTVVLAELKKKKLYFVDSRTSARSVAFEVAEKLGMRAAKRNIFLDNDLSENALKIQMERLLSLARHRGQAIGIGHPHKETLGLLKKYRPELKDKVEMVPISRLVR